MYTVVQDNSIDKLIAKVTEMIKNGWRPLGGISASAGSPVYAQALIKGLP